MDDVYGVMMAGGASSRFFPENKVFSDPTGCGRSMVQQAYDRLTMDVGRSSGNFFGFLPCLPCATREEREAKHRCFISPSNFYCVTGPDMTDEMKRHLPDAHVLTEPGRRNTLPAILWAMANVESSSPNGTMIVVTGDHVIRDLDIFRSSLAQAVEITNVKRAIVTVGINPSKDANEWTGFGAIKGDLENVYKEARRIVSFEEKPSVEEAEAMIKEKCWAWNSGMFVFKMQLMRELLQEFQPEIFKQYSEIVEALKAKNDAAAKDAFLAIKPKMPDPRGTGKQVDTSIDYAIMMRLTHADYKGTAEGFCIPGVFYWVDIGSWNALRSVCDADAQNNVVVGNVSITDSRDAIVLNSQSRNLTIQNTKGVIVVAGNGWVLICREDMAQAVKQVREKALASTDPVVCEQCEPSAINVGFEYSPNLPKMRIAAVGVVKAGVVFAKDYIMVSAE